MTGSLLGSRVEVRQNCSLLGWNSGKWFWCIIGGNNRIRAISKMYEGNSEQSRKSALRAANDFCYDIDWIMGKPEVQE